VKALALIPLVALCGCGLSLKSQSDLANLARDAAQCAVDVSVLDQAGDSLPQILALAATDSSCQSSALDVVAFLADSTSKSAAAVEARATKAARK
jgi:hypothetical protein